MLEKLIAAWKHLWEVVVAHHTEEEQVLTLAEHIAEPFIKSDRAKAALTLAEGIANKANEAIGAAADAQKQ
jgi:hypothetical protein